MARVYRNPVRCSLVTVLLLVTLPGCQLARPSQSWNLPHPPAGEPLPPLPKERPVDEKLQLLQDEVDRRIKATPQDDSLLWRRLGQIAEARHDRPRAIACYKAAAAVAEDVIVRSLVADRLWALGATEDAKSALQGFGYLGHVPGLLPQRRGAKPTELERPRLLAPSLAGRGTSAALQVFPTRLVIQLVVRGAKAETEAVVGDRLRFALQRGPHGGRDASFHDAILCWYYLGHPEEALQATGREAPLWQVITLTCLLGAGATDPESILFPDTRLLERDSDSRVLQGIAPRHRRETALRLERALQTVPLYQGEPLLRTPDKIDMNYFARIAMLLSILGYRDLATLAAQRINEPGYQERIRSRVSEQDTLPFVPVQPAKSLTVVGALAQNLARVGRMGEHGHARQLLRQVFSEARTHGCVSLIADNLAQAAWIHEDPDLIPLLLQEHKVAWFQLAQTLRLAAHARRQKNLVQARTHLDHALALLPTLVKPNQKILLTLDVAEEARLQGELATSTQLRREMGAFADQIKTFTVRTEALLRMARLSYLQKDTAAFETLLVQIRRAIQEAGETFPAEEDRLRIELSGMLVEAGAFDMAYAILQPLKTRSLQAHALCYLIEKQLGLRLPDRTYATFAEELHPIPLVFG